MALADTLRPGSFRGVPFGIQNHEREGGRRGELHEYPERDKPWFEDLGRKARRWSIEAVIVGGQDYASRRDALEQACDATGAATLVHPFLGELKVVCTEWRVRESTAELGAAFFSLTFVDAGEPVTAAVAEDTVDAAIAAADRVQADAPTDFAQQFAVAGFPAFVENAAALDVRRLVELATSAASFLGGAGIALRTFESGLSLLPFGAIALVRSPLSLGHAVVGLIMAVAGLAATPSARVRALRRIMTSPGSGIPPAIAATPARRREQANAAAFSQLVGAVAVAEAVRAASQIRFPSYDEAITLRDALAGEIDDLAIAAADTGADVVADRLDTLRLILIRDITARGGSLERLYRYAPLVTEPALVISQRLHGGSGEVLDRADELAERNAIIHPGFVPGGDPLLVRTMAGRASGALGNG
jgi:prophage DNA circulation protein